MQHTEFNTFNTHIAIKKMMNTGLEEAQAEEIVNAILHGKQFDTSNLATKEDIHNLDSKIAKLILAHKEDFHNLDSKMEKDFTNLKVEVVKIEAKVDTIEANLRAEIQKNQIEIQKSKNDMIKWFIGTTIAMMAVVLSCKFF